MATSQGIGELRLRVEGSFTASELKELARKWGLSPDAAWERSTSDLVRGLLRDAERMFGQSELVRRLRTEKPLVEWPDVETRDAEKWGPKSGLTPMPAEVSVKTLADGTIRNAFPEENTEVRAPDLGSLDLPATHSAVTIVPLAPVTDEMAGPMSAPRSVAPTLAGPASTPTAPSQAAVDSPGPPSGPVSSSPQSSAPRSLPFPGTTTVVEPKPRAGIDPKVLIVVASLMLGLAIVAFGAGFLWSRRPAATANEDPKSLASPSPSGLAGRATQVFDDALLGVASRCEIDVDGPPSSEILASAQEGCGRSVREARRRIADPNLPPSPAEPRTQPRDSATADDSHPIRTQPGLPARPSCVTGCARIHSECMGNCGAEPGDASKFDVWQACSGRCLASESRCRLSCR